MSKLLVLYDFNAQPDSSELTINKDEYLTLLNKDIGEGWWEGMNSKGERGLFPAGYVRVISDESPPQLEKQQQVSAENARYSQVPQQPPHASSPPSATGHQWMVEEPDWPEDEWDDDDSGDNATEYGDSTTGQKGLPTGTPYYCTPAYDKDSNISHPQHYAVDALSSATSNMAISDKAGSNVRAKKNFIRFSNFLKTSLEKYLLEARPIDVPSEHRVYIQYDAELGVVWRPSHNVYSCAISKHGRESKMKGLKVFISYEITPSTNNIGVRRRYKHFDWLMQRLQEKFIFSSLPPLPEKQISGRFHEDFVEHRRNLLQLYTNYITRHPVLSQCDVWWHFITCSTDDMRGWKLGKRKAEKDELVGANFFNSVEVHPNVPPLDSVKITKQIGNFQTFVDKFDESVKALFTNSIQMSKNHVSVYSRDYKRLAASIKDLAMAFQSGTAWRNSLGLNEALRKTGTAYDEISQLYADEPKYDYDPMANILHQYRGLLANWPEVLQLHKHVINTRSEQTKALDQSDPAMARITQRTDITTYVALAEINHFHNERLVDFKQMMQVFLTAQINFHSDILDELL